MRYAIFSDVHANQQAWQAVLADAFEQRAGTLVCLGDVVGYGPKPLEVLNAVREVTPNFVLGNHDAAACGRLDPSIFNDRARSVIEWTREQLDDEARRFLNQVPLRMDGAEIQFVHAELREPGEFGYIDGIGPAELNLKAITSPLAFLGHTHLPLAFKMPRKGGQVTQQPALDFKVERDDRYLINVGSVGEPRSTDIRASYVIYDDVTRQVSFRKVVFDVAAYKADLAEVGLDILPYFVQVFDAQKVAGVPQPAVAPQMALVHLPKVAEVAASHHHQLVVNRPRQVAPLPRPARLAPTVAKPRSNSAAVIGAVTAIVLVLVGICAIVALNTGHSENGVAVRSDVGGRDAIVSPEKSRMGAPQTDRIAIGADEEENLAGTGRPPSGRASPSIASRKKMMKRITRTADGTVTEKLVAANGQPVQALAPTSDPGPTWTAPNFDASTWQQGPNGVGYDVENGEFNHLIATRIATEEGKRPHSVLVRITFEVEDAGAYSELALYMQCDDGFVAFLNGALIASKNAPRSLRWNSAATDQTWDKDAVNPEHFNVSPSLPNLKKGLNVLAVQILNGGKGEPNDTNRGASSSDLLALPELVARRKDDALP